MPYASNGMAFALLTGFIVFGVSAFLFVLLWGIQKHKELVFRYEKLRQEIHVRTQELAIRQQELQQRQFESSQRKGSNGQNPEIAVPPAR